MTVYNATRVTLEEEVTVEGGVFTISRSQVWWDNFYPYRRPLRIASPPTGVERYHPVTIALSSELIRQGKVRSDLRDIEVVQLISASPERWKPLSKEVISTDSGLTIHFNLPIAMEPNAVSYYEYFLYYGKKSTNIGMTRQYVYDPYPLVVQKDDAGITYTKPDTHWVDGEAQIIGAKATFAFYGDQIKVYANTGDNYGIVEVQIDDEEWSLVDLFSSVDQSAMAVYSREGLSSGKHVLRYRVSGEKNSSSSSVRINLDSITYRKKIEAESNIEEVDNRLVWTSVFGGLI